MRLAVLRSELRKPGADRVELPLDEGPTPCSLGIDIDGSIWMRVTCDPASVSTDDGAAAVKFAVLTAGYRVTIAPNVDGYVVEHLLEEMVHLLIEGHPPGDVGRTALQNWRELLARPAGSPLGKEALVGLFGELEVLALILRNGGSFDHWTGWHHDHCDFRLPGLVIEVKATTSANYRRVRIHGLGQLADPEDGSALILVLKRLEASATGTSVPDLIETIVRLGTRRSLLLERLSHLHYSEEHRARYEDFKFVSAEVAIRSIDGSHPRLVPSMLAGVDMSCIDKVDYELNLNGDAARDLPTDLDTIVRDQIGRV